MSSGKTSVVAETNGPPATRTPHSGWARIGSSLQLLVSLGIAAAVLVCLVASPYGRKTAPPAAERRETQSDAVSVVGPNKIHIRAGSSLEKNLEVATVATRSVTVPLLTVTGTVAASLRPGVESAKDYWQFNAPEVLSAFSDWQKAKGDIKFTEAQLESVKELSAARNKSQKEVVERLRELVKAGTESVKDLRAEETNLLQFAITGKKEIHEAETAVLVARRNEATFARQLQQFGLEPELFRDTKADVDIVMADVPEIKAARVKKGQGCQAKFFGIPGRVFPGKVNGIAPVLSKDRRTLRVLFAIEDPDDQLRPGMFAEIGLGTDPRDVTLIPSESAIHLGRNDYVLVGRGNGDWEVADVQVGDLFGRDIELLAGVKVGDRVLGKGSILLKPFVVQALQASTKEEVEAGARKGAAEEKR